VRFETGCALGSVRAMRAEVIGVEGLAVAIRSPEAPDGLVGERDRGLVVAGPFGQRQSPFLGSIEWFALVLRELRGQQCGSGAVDQQGAQVAVAAFGYASESSRVAAGVFARWQAERAGEVAAGIEARKLTNVSVRPPHLPQPLALC